MWSVLALVTLVVYADATGIVPGCPEGCYCGAATFYTTLLVDCTHIFPDVDEKQLYHQLNSMLSADHFVKNLTFLNITNSPLTRVPASVCKLLSLTSLYLDRNKVNELPDKCFTKLTKLVTLSMRINAIIGLHDGLFDGLQNLNTIDLEYNRIAFIGLRVFSNSSDMTSLRLVDLAHNRLTSLEPWWYYRCIVGDQTYPVRIQLYYNWISNFTNELNFRFKCGMKRPYGYLDLSRNRITHIMDSFNGWNIGRVSFYTTLFCLRNYQGSNPRMTFNFFGSKYHCGCTDFPLYKLNVLWQSEILHDVFCDNHELYSDMLERRRVTTIPLDTFSCVQPDRCPSSCRCVYRPANTTLHVYCSAANLSSLPLDLPPLPKGYVKYKLDFSKNKLLRRLEYRPYFINSSAIDFSNCSITYIDVGMLTNTSRFSWVNFRGNMLESFPREVDTVNISARLLIGNNPWRCSCDNSWMIGWLQSLSHRILDPGDIVCISPSRMYGRNIVKSTVEDFCVDPVKRILTITLSAVSSVAAVILLLVITGIVIFKLRVKFYRRWKFHPFDRDECVGEDMDYDVFLCSSSEDHNPHALRILGEMEGNGYRVCYHERDFLPGQLITDNMGHGIERSKRTVCLISENFLRR